ncbi:MAG: DUF5615 family PIN-like protein [Planctomycetota bacterium]
MSAIKQRFKIDENLPVEAADLLRGAGHDAATVVEQSLGGRPDPAIAAVCQVEQRVLVTLDRGFADIRTYPPERHAGIVLLRPPTQDVSAILQLLESLLPKFGELEVRGHLWTVTERLTRIRPDT